MKNKTQGLIENEEPIETNEGLSRRNFVKSALYTTALASVSTMTGGLGFIRSTQAAVPLTYDETRKHFVFVFLRGGADALSFLTPRAGVEKTRYTQMRGDLALSESELITGNAQYSLNAALAPLTQSTSKKDLRFLMGVGSSLVSRSHFAKMDDIEAYSTISKRGFLGKLSDNIKSYNGDLTFKGVSIAERMPMSMSQAANVFMTKNLLRSTLLEPGLPAGIPTVSAKLNLLERFKALFKDANNSAMVSRVKEVLDMKYVNVSPVLPLTSTQVVGYRGEIGSSLREVCNILKHAPENRVIHVDYAGWDHHKDLKINFKSMANNLASSLAQLRSDILNDPISGQEIWNKTVIVVMSEFGRNVFENGVNGVDHGRGGMALLYGGNVNGGQNNELVVDSAPEILTNLYEGNALQVNWRFQDLLTKIFSDHMGNTIPIWPSTDVSNVPAILKSSV